MVHVINNKQKVIYKRLARRGFSEEDCQNVIQNKRGGVIAVKKRNIRPNCIKVKTASRGG